MRTSLAVAGICLCLTHGAFAGDVDPALYEAKAIVTGTDMRDRPTGFARCFRDVLVKVSGNPDLLDDSRVDDMAGRADQWVVGYDYQDRLSDMPRHDEQGSRDRPHDLSVRFDPGRIDEVLAELGEHPWKDPRPKLLAVLRIHDARGRAYRLRDAGDDADGQREALTAAAEKYGLSVRLPPRDGETGSFRPADGEAAINGAMTWSEKAGGWMGSWWMTSGPHRYAWQVRGVSFDSAFRDMMRGALRILSGHGAPPHRQASTQ